MAKRKLSESQAWAEMASAFRKAVPCTQGDYAVEMYDDTIFGICQYLHWLCYHERISGVTASRVFAEIDGKRRGKGYCGQYCWGNDKRGMAARSRFCAKMAEKTKKQPTKE